MFWHWRLTKLDTSLPHSPSAQLAEAQAEQIVQVLQKRWNGEEPPSEFPPIKLKGILGSLGKKTRLRPRRGPPAHRTRAAPVKVRHFVDVQVPSWVLTC